MTFALENANEVSAGFVIDVIVAASVTIDGVIADAEDDRESGVDTPLAGTAFVQFLGEVPAGEGIEATASLDEGVYIVASRLQHRRPVLSEQYNARSDCLVAPPQP